MKVVRSLAAVLLLLLSTSIIVVVEALKKRPGSRAKTARQEDEEIYWSLLQVQYADEMSLPATTVRTIRPSVFCCHDLPCN